MCSSEGFVDVVNTLRKRSDTIDKFIGHFEARFEDMARASTSNVQILQNCFHTLENFLEL